MSCNTTSSATGEEKTSAAVDDVESSSITPLSHQMSDSSSQPSSSQENVLQCSESMVSSTPSDDSQGNSQPVSTDGTNVSKADTTEVPTSSGKQERTELETTPTTVEPSTPDKPHVSASNGLHYSPGFLATSNLSQLAELAANKSAMNQTPPNSVQTPTAQPHLLGNQSRFVIPTQGITPGMFGTYQTSPIVQYHGFTPTPATQVPSPFVKGSIIQLTSGELKRVEDLTTEDFVHSTKLYPDHKLDTSTVVKIEDGTDAGCTHITFTINSSKKQVTLNCPVEHPFFVYGQGWTSSRPDQSLAKYSLSCQPLKVGDVCIFLSPSAVSVLPSVPSTQATTATPSGTLSVPVKGAVSVSSTGQTPSSVTVSYAQTLAGMAALPGNMQGVVVTSSLPAGIPAIYPGTFPPPQGKVGSTQSGADRLATTQPIVVYTADGKPSDPQHPPALVSGGFPLAGGAYYQPLPGSLMTSVPPGQTFVQGTVVPQGSVGNGLLVAAVGFVPGRQPPFVQPGMLYNPSPVEVVPKAAGDGKAEEYQQKAGRTDTRTELSSQPDAKRAKAADTEVK